MINLGCILKAELIGLLGGLGELGDVFCEEESEVRDPGYLLNFGLEDLNRWDEEDYERVKCRTRRTRGHEGHEAAHGYWRGVYSDKIRNKDLALFRAVCLMPLTVVDWPWWDMARTEKRETWNLAAASGAKP